MEGGSYIETEGVGHTQHTQHPARGTHEQDGTEVWDEQQFGKRQCGRAGVCAYEFIFVGCACKEFRFTLARKVSEEEHFIARTALSELNYSRERVGEGARAPTSSS